MKKSKIFSTGIGIIIITSAATTMFNIQRDPLPGDVNSDGIVNKLDEDLVLGNYGGKCKCSNCDCPTDINKDGKTDAADLGIVIANIGIK